MAIKILIVDDEQSVADSVAEVIKDAGYAVCVAYSSQDAIAKAAEFCPDVLLSDVLMPGKHGFELALEIKRMYPNCRLLLFSGQASTAEIASSFVEIFTSLGYRFELLPKPLHPVTLLKKLEDSLLYVS